MSKLQVFKGEFQEFANFVSPSGKTVSFYQGYLATEDPEIIAFVKTLEGVKELVVTKDLKVPTPPERKRSRNWAAQNNPMPTQITPMELLQRAVQSSSQTPQAIQSSSAAG